VSTPIESRLRTPENASPTRYPFAGAAVRVTAGTSNDQRRRDGQHTELFPANRRGCLAPPHFRAPPSGVLHTALNRRRHNCLRPRARFLPPWLRQGSGASCANRAPVTHAGKCVSDSVLCRRAAVRVTAATSNDERRRDGLHTELSPADRRDTSLRRIFRAVAARRAPHGARSASTQLPR